MTASRSLRSRLAWSATVVTALWLVLLAVGGNLALGAALGREAATLLQARADATAETVQVGPDQRVVMPMDREDAALDGGTWVFAADGSVAESPPGTSADLDARAAALAGRGPATEDVALDEPVRLRSRPVVIGGRQVATVVASISLEPYDQLRRLAWIGSAALAAGLLVVVHLVLRANVRRSLRPVQEMTAQADRWSADDVERRFGEGRRPAELDELAHTLDTVLDRLGAVLRRERQLGDQLGHELRTPLARIRAEVDLLASRPRDAAEVAAAHASIGEAVSTMQGIVDVLMSAARAGSSSLQGRTPVEPVLRQVAGRLRVQRPDIEVAVRAVDSTRAGVDSAVLERLLAPVVENAGRYARGRVELVAVGDGSRVRVLVADDGPGVAAAHREKVFDPGFRGTPDDDHTGAGLGLALARRLAEAAGGRVQVDGVGPGGRFLVELPAA